MRSEKEKLELSACEQFLSAFNQMFDCKLKTISHGDKPDFIVEDAITKKKIGLEIAHLFQDKREAILLLRRANGLHGFMAMDDAINVLNEQLQKKCVKALNYNQNYPLELIIRVASRIWEKNDFEMACDRIVVPDCKYIHIWLIFSLNPQQLLKLK